jgi:hypothetical protein
MKGRVHFQQHDFFTVQPNREASVYLYRNVFHKHNDEDAKKLLQCLLPALENRNEAVQVLVNDCIVPQYGTGGVTRSEEYRHMRHDWLNDFIWKACLLHPSREVYAIILCRHEPLALQDLCSKHGDVIDAPEELPHESLCQFFAEKASSNWSRSSAWDCSAQDSRWLTIESVTSRSVGMEASFCKRAVSAFVILASTSSAMEDTSVFMVGLMCSVGCRPWTSQSDSAGRPLLNYPHS